MKNDEYLKRLRTALLEGRPSSIAEVVEENKPAAGTKQFYVLPGGYRVDFDSDVVGYYPLPDGTLFAIPGLLPPESSL